VKPIDADWENSSTKFPLEDERTIANKLAREEKVGLPRMNMRLGNSS
jgi:hypothetical protein